MSDTVAGWLRNQEVSAGGIYCLFCVPSSEYSTFSFMSFHSHFQHLSMLWSGSVLSSFFMATECLQYGCPHSFIGCLVGTWVMCCEPCCWSEPACTRLCHLVVLLEWGFRQWTQFFLTWVWLELFFVLKGCSPGDSFLELAVLFCSVRGKYSITSSEKPVATV